MNNNSMTQTVIKNPTWWKRRSGLERGLMVIAISGSLLCIALAVTLAIFAANTTTYQIARNWKRETSKGLHTVNESLEFDDICVTPGCIHAASEVLKNMDPDVEPCDDFYKFACGKFIEDNVIPDDKITVDMFSFIYDVLNKQLRIIIEQESPPNEPAPFTLARNLYKACMNTTKIEKLSFQPLLENLRKLGGWPVLDGEQWNDGDFTWKDSVYRFRKYGYSVDYFIAFTVMTDIKNNSRRLINLAEASLGMSREYLLKGFNEKFVQSYYRYMVDIAEILGANRDRAKEELKQLLEFEIRLANISMPKETQRNMTSMYNPKTINELSTAYPSIPWWEYFHTILASQEQLNSDEIIIVKVPNYLKDFEKLVNRTPKRVLANYALWRVVAESIDGLSDDIRKRQLKYWSELVGSFERGPRWKECINILSGNLGISIGSMYVRKYFNEDAKKNALAMVNDVKRAFISILKKVDWMDEKTKANALEKAYKMTSHIAYPDELLNDQKLEEHFSKLELRSDDYFGNLRNLSIFKNNFEFGRLRIPVNKTEWISHARPATVDAFSWWVENSIEITAGILQGAFFSNDRPRYMNYGGIGPVIGHEITHGFDDIGKEFNKDGNLVNWWQPDTKQQYLKNAECIVYQYGNYTVKDVDLNLNGINTQGENIADNGGIKAAYLAYNEWVKRNWREQTLPGLPYTPKQMFWISAANVCCSKYRPETMKLQIMSDAHSPPEFRVIGTMSNIEAFARDFNCPVGSKMNPQNKCTVW